MTTAITFSIRYIRLPYNQWKQKKLTERHSRMIQRNRSKQKVAKHLERKTWQIRVWVLRMRRQEFFCLFVSQNVASDSTHAVTMSSRRVVLLRTEDDGKQSFRPKTLFANSQMHRADIKRAALSVQQRETLLTACGSLEATPARRSSALLVDKKLIIELHYGTASGSTLVRHYDSFRQWREGRD